MRKLRIILIVCASILFTNVFAQLKDYNLSDYKLPDIDRRSLDIDFNLYGNNYFDQTINPDPALLDTKNGFNRLNGIINVDYTHYLNTTRHQRETSLGINFNAHFYNRKEDKELMYRSIDISPTLHFLRENRTYTTSNIFFETNIFLNYRYDMDNNLSRSNPGDTLSDNNLRSHDMIVHVPLKIGVGRIEQIQDARHAIYLFDELLQVDRLSIDFSDLEITELAMLVSKLKNERFFDSRLRKMEEIESIDSFLINNKYVKQSDAIYFTTLSDIWEYGNKPIRNSGTRISAAIIPGYNYYDFKRSGGSLISYMGKYNMGTVSLDGGVEFAHEKPLNMYWQNTINLEAYAGMMIGTLEDKENDSENNINIPNIQLGLNQVIGFYPSTRTDMHIGYSIQYVQLFGKSDSINNTLGAEAKGIMANTNMSINYYFSPQLRLNVSSTLYYTWQNSKDEVDLHYSMLSGNHYYSNHFHPNKYSSNYKLRNLNHYFRVSLLYSIF